jgi:predicted chitinase
MINTAKFFTAIRGTLFKNLTQSQVYGINTILSAAAGLPISYQAYMLATAYRETARTMQPIAEYGHGKGHPYGLPAGPYGQVYYGRGYVQLTWLENYQRADKALHAAGVLKADEDLVKNPDLALRQDVAAHIMLHGMVEGWFPRKKLSDYLPGDYVGARHIINGTDHAQEIAQNALAFEAALS